MQAQVIDMKTRKIIPPARRTRREVWEELKAQLMLNNDEKLIPLYEELETAPSHF